MLAGHAGPGWLMAAQILTGPPYPPPPTFKPGNNCKLNLEPGCRLWREPISSTISFSSVGHLLVISPSSPSPRELLHPRWCLLCSVLMSWPIFLWHLSILLWFYMTYWMNSWEINMTSLIWFFLNIQIYFHHFDKQWHQTDVNKIWHFFHLIFW